MATSGMQQGSTAERFAPLSGVVFGILAIIAVAMTRDIAFLDPADEIATEFLDNTGNVLATSQALVLAAFALAWFGASLRSTIQRAEGAGGRLAGLAFGGMLLAAGMLLVSAVAFAAPALRADDAGAIDPNSAATMSDFSMLLGAAAAPVAAAIALAATALAALRYGGIMPNWLAYLTAVLAVALVILPINYIAMPLFVLWSIAVGAMLYLSPEGVTARAGQGTQGQAQPA